MKTPKLKVGDQVRVIDAPDHAPDSGTVVQIGRFMVRVFFPIRKYVWVPLECCEKISGRKS